ncbi:MAG: phenylalanine--tRNA ligase subunit beta [Candidatus Omnitrophota bacterium]
MARYSSGFAALDVTDSRRYDSKFIEFIADYDRNDQFFIMKLPYSWLSQFVDRLPPPEVVAELLTMRGFEVEEISCPGSEIKDIIVAKILEMAPHPDADKLTLCQVTDGSQQHEIVCGAKNMKAGDHVALAYIGTVLPGNFKLEKRKIRGIYSQGMLCSTRELGLGDDHAGIMILPPEYKIGRRLIDEMGLNDSVFEINVTPNRPDALSVLGIAREIAAALGEKAHVPGASLVSSDKEIDLVPSIDLVDGDLCPRYTALILKDVKIGPSPQWVKDRLEACGVRSVNNAVDATNLVLMEMGQPLHAFDLDKLHEKRIVVRRGRIGEKLVSIDGDERILDEEMLVIADAEVPCAVAGVMGGLESEVSEETTAILLESAYFDPSCIRRTSKRLGLSSEASYRFERGVDFETVIPASYRCAQLILELAGGYAAGSMGIADTPDCERLESLRGRMVRLRYAYCDRLLGQIVPRDEMEKILVSLQFSVEKKDKESMTLRVPSHRLDVCIEADLAEEIARCYGYEKFTPTLPAAPVKAPEPQEIDRGMALRIRQYLIGFGLDEAVTYSFSDPEGMKAFPPEGVSFQCDETTVLNPINVNEATMRTAILPSLLQCAKRNAARGNADFGLFELARIYLPQESGHEENRMISGVIVGNPGADWRSGKKERDFFDVKGLVEGMLSLCALRRYRSIEGPACLHPKRGATIQEGKQTLGYYGELHPNLAEKYELPGRVLVFEIGLKPLSDAYRSYTARYRPFSLFPAIKRDIALLMPEGVPARKVETIIRRESGDLLENLEMFDYYRGKQVAQGFISAAFRMTYRSREGTLKDDEIDVLIGKILNGLKKELDVQLRS